MIGFVSRSRTGLPQRIEALAEAVEVATDRLDDDDVAFGRHVVDKAGQRLVHGTTHTLVAVLGATGSGKSSLCNVVVGDQVATTGVRRPTTTSTLACWWGADDVQPLLDWLEIKNRHHVAPGTGDADDDTEHDELEGLVLLDVPDHDSIAEDHRLEMERIAEHADLLLWVTDPEKYADKAMHDYLAGLAGHGSVVTMVLNKADTMEPDDLRACRTDLQRLLHEAGLDRAPVLAVSALSGYGIETLEALLIDTVKSQQAVVERLAADTALAADTMLDGLGPARGPTSVPDRVAGELAGELVDSSGLGLVTEAVAAGHRRDAARRTGWPFTRWVRRLRPHPMRRFHLGAGSAGRASLPEPSGVQLARSAGAVRGAVASVSAELPPPWPTRIAEVGTPDAAELSDRIDTAIAEAARPAADAGPRWWRLVGAIQILLAAAVVVGAVWLGLLAGAAYLRIPEPPTPTYRDIPIPTGLLLGGIALGLLVSFVASRAAAVGASRRSRAVRRRAERAVREVADELIIDPIDRELTSRAELRRLLAVAKGAT